MKNAKKSAVSVVVATPVTSVKAEIWKGDDTIKSKFIGAVGSFVKAKDAVAAAFAAAREAIVGKRATKDGKKLLRRTLIAWSVEAGLKESVAKVYVSNLFKDAGLAMKPGVRKADPEVTKKATAALAAVRKALPGVGDDELKTILRAVIDELSE